MAQREFVYQDRNGVQRSMIWDESDPNTFATRVKADFTDTIENIRTYRELHPARSNNKLVAKVPIHVAERAMREDWDDADWAKWLNDPDNADWRVWEGRV